LHIRKDLQEKNLIDKTQPNSIHELAEITGKKYHPLSQSLKTMARYGIVE